MTLKTARKNQLIMGASFTLLTLSIVAIQLINWHNHGIDLGLSGWEEWKGHSELEGLLFYLLPTFDTRVAAVFAIITFWLPPKPQLVFGIVALVVSVGLLSCEGLVLFMYAGARVFGAPRVYTGIDPIFMLAIIALTAVAMGMGITWSNKAKRSGL